MGKIFFKGTIENIWMTNKLMSICSTLLNSRKIKKKKNKREVSPEIPSSWTSKSFKEDSKLTYTHIKMATVKMLDHTKYWQRCGRTRIFINFWW